MKEFNPLGTLKDSGFFPGKGTSFFKIKSPTGFTLVELMIVVLIFALILGSIYYTFSAGLGAWERGEQAMALHQDVRQFMRLFTKELRCAFVDSDNKIRFVGKDIKEDEADYDAITFFSMSPPRLKSKGREMGILKITYALEKDPSQEYYTLFRKEAPALGEIEFSEETSQTILENIYSFNLEYFSGEDWEKSWHSDELLPERVRINLTLLTKDGSTATFTTATDIPCGA